jgi:hypothetical protein
MAKVCIPQEITDLIKKDIPSQAIRSIAALDSKKLNDNIQEIVESFRQKSLFGNEEDALMFKKAINEKIVEIQKEKLTQSVNAKASRTNSKLNKPDSFLERIDKISRIEDFNDDLIQEGIEIKLGARLTGDEVKNLIEASNNLGEYLDFDGNPNELAFLPKEQTKGPIREYNPKYANAINEFNKIKDSIVPSSTGDKANSTFNANLLANLKSPVTNVIANSASLTAFMGEAAIKYGAPYRMDVAWDTALKDAGFYSKTGFDVTRAEDINQGIKTFGETLSAFDTTGEGINFEKVLAGVNNIVYTQALGTPDQGFASLVKNTVVFSEAKNRILKDNPNIKIDTPEFNLLWEKTVNDARLFTPKTQLGKDLKNLGVSEANKVTFQEQSVLATFGATQRANINETVKKLLIEKAGFSEDVASWFKVGTWAVPFVMTAANAIDSGMSYSGVYAGLQGFTSIVKGIPKAATPGVARNIIFENMKKIEWQKPLVGIPAAIAMASFIPASDYIGSYPNDPNEKRLIELGRATTNSIRVEVPFVGEKWVSLDLLGPIAAPLVGILEAKKTPNVTLMNVMGAYAIGASRQLTQLPALEGMNSLTQSVTEGIKTYSESLQAEEGNSVQELSTLMGNSLTGFIASRFIPSLVGDVGEAFDETKRTTDTGQFNVYGINLDPAAIKIPGLREQLPEKQDVFGEDIKTEGVSQIFFGARVKTPSDDKVILELEKMRSEGETKTPTDYIGKKAKQYYNIPDNKIPEEKTAYGNQMYDAYKELIESSDWNSLTLQDKIDSLSKVESDVKDNYKDTLEEKYGKVEKE